MEENDLCPMRFLVIDNTRKSSSVRHGRQASLKESDQFQFDLPDEILAMVFQYLPLRDRCRLSTVSTQWRRCAFHILHYFSVSLRGQVERISLKIFDRDDRWFISDVIGAEKSAAVLEQFQRSRIGHLDLEVSKGFCDKKLLCLMADIARRARTVSVAYNLEITLRSRPPPSKAFNRFCEMFGPYIVRFNFSTEEDMRAVFSPERFRVMLANLKKLKTIGDMTMTLLLPFRGKVPDDCFQLVEDVVIHDLNYDNPSMSVWWQGFIDRFQNQLKRLEIRVLEKTVSISEQLSGIHRFAKLEFLLLNRCTWSDYEMNRFVPLLRELAVGCPRLTNFGLRYGWNSVTSAAVENFFAALCKIKQLQILNLCVEFRLREAMCDELAVVRMLRMVASAKKLYRNLTIKHIYYWNGHPTLRVFGSMRLRNFFSFRRIQTGQRTNVQKRCETYYI